LTSIAPAIVQCQLAFGGFTNCRELVGVIAPGRSDEDMRSLFLNPHELELLERFNSSGVRYLIIGGHAVQFHGYLRTAKDLDIFIDRSHDNAELIVCALCYLGFSGTDLTAELFCEPKKQIPLGRYQAELLTSPHGPPFGEAYDRRVIANERGIPIPVISYKDLLHQKRLLARPQDIADIEELEKAIKNKNAK
jgi:hypothetical protein